MSEGRISTAPLIHVLPLLGTYLTLTKRFMIEKSFPFDLGKSGFPGGKNRPNMVDPPKGEIRGTGKV